MTDDYSRVAAEQLDAMEASTSDELWNTIMDACELALRLLDQAQKWSAAITTKDGQVVFRLVVVGHPPYKVFWAHREPGPRIEAVFPHP